MKKYVHVWFVILATLLAIVLGTTAQAHPHSVKKHKQKHHIVKQKKKHSQYTVRRERAVHKSQRKHVPTRDPIETLIANEYRESKIIQHGTASWYGPGFYGRKTASGEVFTKTQLTAAHPTLPMGTKLRVTNNDTGESVVVKVNDRGPFHGNRIIDLSHAAAKTIGLIQSGVCSVKIERII
jgi:rare lipoprotein A (peptidoglycan hydrolase)